MVRYPYTLEIWHEEDATQNPDGSWTDGFAQWRTVGRCNARQVNGARQINGQNGEAFFYSFEVVMPANTQPIAIGTRVRIIDNTGRNIFDRSGLNNPEDCQSPNCRLTDEVLDTVSYQVKGFYKSGQRYEDTRLWL